MVVTVDVAVETLAASVFLAVEVRTCCRIATAAKAMVAVVAHALGVVLRSRVRTLVDDLRLVFLVHFLRLLSIYSDLISVDHNSEGLVCLGR